MLIQNAVTISQEVQSGTAFGSVRLYHVDDPTKPESSARRMLALTYPAQALRQALSAVAQRLSGERTQGTSDGWGGPTSSSKTWRGGRQGPGGALSPVRGDPDFARLCRMPPQRAYALADAQGCCVRGRYGWSTSGAGQGDVDHYGLSLMECLTPRLVVRRE